MNELNWLIGHRFQSLTHREFDWVLVFDQGASITISCLWRICERGRIRFTSEDDGHQFGLPVPVDAAAEVNRRLTQDSVDSVLLKEGVLDLEIQFHSGCVFQIIPTSAGYEAWQIEGNGKHFLAVGGGELANLTPISR